nr:MAG TPA: hypothetical protein [Caudoviricetes sp.]
MIQYNCQEERSVVRLLVEIRLLTKNYKTS